MKISCKIILFVLLFLLGQHIQAQTSGNKAKELYLQAENAYRIRDYSKSFELLNQVQSSLGSNNAMIESLRAKNYFEQGEYQKTKSSLDVFFTFGNTAENLLTEMYGLLEKTDAKIKEAQERKIAEQQKAIRDEQARVEKESQEKKDYQDALEANSVYQYNRFISSYPNSQYISDIKDRLGYAYVALGEEYTSAKKYEDAIKLYDECIKKFPDGINSGRIKTNLAEVYYLLGEQERSKGNHSSAKSYYNKAVSVRVYFAYSRYYEQAQARLNEYNNAELQNKKDKLMAKAIESKTKSDEYYSLHRKWVGFGLAGSLVGTSGIIYGASTFGVDPTKDESKSTIGTVAFAFGIPVLIAGATSIILSPKYKRWGREYKDEYLKYIKQADGIKLSFAPVIAPNQTYGLALRIDF